MHRLSTSFILGYHGCDLEVAEALLDGKPFRRSENDYDWLGPGIYFWEANPRRGLDFARDVSRRRGSSVKNPTVVGAVIDLGLCLDMTTMGAIEMMDAAYRNLKSMSDVSGVPLPRNGSALLLRRLDCAVVSRLHELLSEEGTRIDTVRGLFIEGPPIYPEAGFHAKTHTQIAVCNPDCIKGVFRVAAGALG